MGTLTTDVAKRILVLSPDAHVHILGFSSRYRNTGL